MRLITLTTVLLAALALLPAAASASPRQYALFQDEALITDNGGTRGPTLDEVKGLGADMIKIQLNWATAAPAGRTKPKGFDGRDPSQYPGWSRYDDTIAAIKARGLKVMVALAPPAPGWATPTRGDREGVTRPSAREFGRFAEAAARRYPGVDVWTLWNEPNHPRYLFPQSTKGGRPVAPGIYRGMVRAAVAGLHRGGSGHDPILFGELLPIGKPVDGPLRNLQPLKFLRSFFRGKPLSGLAGFAYHPYTRPAGPLNPDPTANDATMHSLGRVLKVLDQARASGKLKSKQKLPIWDTEFGFQTNPPDPFAARIASVPRFWGLSELWFSYSNRRVKTISQYTMDDQPGPASLWQGGLRFSNGALKSDIYTNYRLPILVRQLGPGAVEVRGAARPGGAGSTVQIFQRLGRKGSFKALGAPIGVRNVRGYFIARFRIPKAGFRTFYFNTGGQSSLKVKPVRIF